MEREGQYDEAARGIVSVVVAGDNGCNQLPKSMGTELVIIAKLELEQAASQWLDQQQHLDLHLDLHLHLDKTPLMSFIE